jgi:hypothetical protein
MQDDMACSCQLLHDISSRTGTMFVDSIAGRRKSNATRRRR